MLEYLQGFEERMGFIAAVDSIVGRRNRSAEIEELSLIHISEPTRH